ncbi:hypothetical protein ACRAWG_11495 [Methylobacterium sp. P31]
MASTPGLSLEWATSALTARRALAEKVLAARNAAVTLAIPVARHLQVDEQELYGRVVLFEHADRIGNAHGVQHANSGSSRIADRVHQDQGVIVDERGLGRTVRDRIGHAPQSATGRKIS